MSRKERRLILVGGGHTHALLLHGLAFEPLDDAEITLVSDVEKAPYSGMLPGHVAGAYTREEMHIDLRALADAAGTQLVIDQVTGWCQEKREIRLASGEFLAAGRDGIVSFNVGSAPDLSVVPES